MMPPSPNRSTRLLPRLLQAFHLQRWRIERVLGSGGDEAVHDLRVALRRTASLASMGRGVPATAVSRALQRCARDLRRELSVHRSQEVSAALLLKRFEDDPRRRAAARAAARRIFGGPPPGSALQAAAFLRRVDRLRSLFDARERELSRLIRAGDLSTAGESAADRLDRRAALRLRKLAARLAGAGPPRRPTLHAFRIAAKRLRYTLEFLEEAVPGAQSLLRGLRQFQDLSGDAHDRMELAAVVKRRATASRPGAPVRALLRPLEADARRAVAQALDAATGVLDQVRGLLACLGPFPSKKGQLTA